MYKSFTTGLLVVVAATLYLATIRAQQPDAAQLVARPLEIAQGPSVKGFELRRLNTENYGNFVPFYVTRTEPLAGALKDGRVTAATPVLVLMTAGGRLALLTDQMAYHHLAQGRAGGKEWLATF